MLYLGRRRNAYIDGLALADSEALLDELWSYVKRPEFAWEHVWRVGDLVLWDNRCTMHRRDAFDPANAASCTAPRSRAKRRRRGRSLRLKPIAPLRLAHIARRVRREQQPLGDQRVGGGLDLRHIARLRSA